MNYHTILSTLCQFAPRLVGLPDDCDEKVREGCVCEEGLFRNGAGDCVEDKDCDRCEMNGRKYKVSAAFYI